MSATLDGARVGKLLGDAPVVESEGRAFPVETRYLGREPSAGSRADGATRSRRAARRCRAVLVFLPGAGEIRRVEELLGERGA